MAKKKNKPARPEQTSLDRADKYLFRAYQSLNAYIPVNDKSQVNDHLLTRIHALHDQLLLSMKQTGSGQRIYREDFNKGDPRPAIADTYCHYMAPMEADGVLLARLAALAALNLVKRAAAFNQITALKRTLELPQCVFMDQVRTIDVFQKIAADYVLTSEYLNKADMSVLWIAIILEAPQDIFERICQAVDDNLLTPEDLDMAAKALGLAEDEDEEDWESEDLDEDEDTNEESTGESGVYHDNARGVTAQWGPLDSKNPMHRRFYTHMLLKRIDRSASENGKKLFEEDLRWKPAKLSGNRDFIELSVQIIKQMSINEPCFRSIDSEIKGSEYTPQVCLILLRNCRTFAHLQLEKLFPDEDVHTLREASLERLGEHYRRILNFLQDCQLYQQGNSLGSAEVSPIVSQYWRRKGVVSELPNCFGIPEPLQDVHTELPLFVEVEERIQKAITRRMRRGVEDFFGRFSEDDAIQIGAGLWELGMQDSLWLDNYLTSSLCKVILAYSPFRTPWLNHNDPPFFERDTTPPDDFLERIRPLMDVIYDPEKRFDAQGPAALNFNDLMHSAGYHSFNYSLVDKRRSTEYLLWNYLKFNMPQSDLLLGAVVIQKLLEEAEDETYSHNQNVRRCFDDHCLRSFLTYWKATDGFQHEFGDDDEDDIDTDWFEFEDEVDDTEGEEDEQL